MRTWHNFADLSGVTIILKIRKLSENHKGTHSPLFITVFTSRTCLVTCPVVGHHGDVAASHAAVRLLVRSALHPLLQLPGRSSELYRYIHVDLSRDLPQRPAAVFPGGRSGDRAEPLAPWTSWRPAAQSPCCAQQIGMHISSLWKHYLLSILPK
jgi:hypothetical protein